MAKTKVGKRKVNPLFRSRMGTGRPKMAFNGQKITCTGFVDHSLGASNIVTDWFSVDCNAGEALNRFGTDVLRHYQEYKYLAGTCEWIPKIGPTSNDAGSRVSIAFMDNPELMNTFENATAATKVSIVKTLATCKTFNLWERFVYRVPLTYRRKWFNVNVNLPAVGSRTAEEFDRSAQGKVVVCIETTTTGAPASGVLGQWKVSSTTMLQGFTSTNLT